MTVRVPERLKRGDLIGLVAPASPVIDGGRIERGVRYLESLGYRVRPAKHIERRDGYLAGADGDRAADLHAMFADRRVKAVFCLRGGYGTPRLLPLLDYRMIARNPKILLGYSDITALALALWTKCRLVTFHGPMAAVEMAGAIDPRTEESLWQALTSTARRRTLAAADPQSAQKGRARAAAGRLLGGNLSLVVALMGTPYRPEFRGTILFLEEIGEEPYRVDRMLTQLALGGVTRGAAAIALGRFTSCTARDPASPTRSLEEVTGEIARSARGPVAAGFPIGHEPHMVTVPLGARARLDGSRGVLELLEAPVR